MKGYNNIKDKLSQLPTHSVDEKLWESIEEKLPRAISFDKLPEHKAPENIWNNITEALPQRKTRRLVPYWAAAASVIVLFSLTLLLRTGSQNEQILVAEEIITEDVIPEQAPEMNKEITIYCDQYPSVCSSDKFAKLKKQLDELKAQKSELNTLKSYDSDPQIDVYIEHINLELSTIQRKLIAMF
ncbi:hypothetical protein ACE01N_11250 [Saccharicrinis sp. FJH2]|uniref:hypothetical protein n=1 Tax=Saccharicrinis sp. FJH65 TaxID=3344659 RepID=UPI0035F33C58